MPAGSTGGFLSPYRVLDLTDERGLLAGHLLAQLGAEVIQVELPGGSRARCVGPFDGAASLFWECYAAGKRGITLDYASAEGRAALLALVAGADFLIESGRPGEMQALGLGYAALRLINPRLIHVSITAFGTMGPKAGYADHDLILWAAAGTLAPHRTAEGLPLRISVPQAFHHAAADAACGALVALRARQVTGAGQHVEVSAQQSCILCTLSSHLADAVGHDDFNLRGAALSQKVLDLSGSGIRTRKTKWQVRDGLVEMHLGMGQAAGRHANALFAWLLATGRLPTEFAAWDWVAIPARIETGEVTAEQLERVRAVVGEVLAGFSKAELLWIAQDRNLLLAPVMDMADLRHSPHLAARAFYTQAGENGCTLPAPFMPGCGSGTAPWLRAAPMLGEHTAEVLGTLPKHVPPAPMSEPEPKVPALSGLKVLDLCWVVAGPLAGRMLADFGAIVVRVESSRRVDTARMMGPFPGAKLDSQKSILFENCNANKLGITLDLQSEQGREVIRDLVAWADVVMESFRPGQMAKLGLDYQSLRAINPGLIMLSTSLLGQTGPNAGFAGFGNVGAALSGIQHLVGEAGGLPIGPYGPYTDFVGPRFSLLALLAAVDHRRRTGEGCWLDISQVESTIALLAPQVAEYDATGRIAAAQGNRDAACAPCGVFPTLGEDCWIAIAAPDDGAWRRLAEVVGGTALAGDARFSDLAARKRHEDRLEALIADWAGRRLGTDIEAMLQAQGVPAHIVATSADMLADAHLAARGQFIRLPHPLMGESIFDAARCQLSATPAAYEHPAPHFARDTQHVLAELIGYSQQRIDALLASDALS